MEKATKTAVKAKKTVVKKAVKKTKAVEADGSFAVIATGGKQYLVKVGDVLNIELLNDAKEGTDYSFDKVLLVAKGDDVTIGSPLVEGAEVTAKMEKEVRGKKVITQKYKNKTRSSIKKGHRQTYSRVKIVSIK